MMMMMTIMMTMTMMMTMTPQGIARIWGYVAARGRVVLGGPLGTLGEPWEAHLVPPRAPVEFRFQTLT